MGVSLSDYRACIGCFNIIRLKFRGNLGFSINFITLQNFLIAFLSFCLLLSGDVEVNPGPERETTLSVCHWNLNSVSVDNFIKIKQLTAFLNIYKFDIVCCEPVFSLRLLPFS